MKKKQIRTKKTERIQHTDKTMRIIPLGGLREVGKNMTVYEYEGEILIVDTGVIFPDEELLGVDVVIPDVTYLENNYEKIKGIVYTHGHEDHIGAAPYILRKFNVPIYGTTLTLALIQKKLQEHGIKGIKMHERNNGDTFRVGKFSVEFIKVNHSIPGSVALHISTEAGNVFQTGDFKVDYTPVSGGIIDLARIGQLGKQGIDLLLSDSTNAQRPGHTLSESSVGYTFETLFRESKGRILVASFASNLYRIQQVFNAAKAANRKIAFTGRSMHTLTSLGIKYGYLHIPENDIIDIRDVGRYPDNEIVIVTTGSQGEPMAALTRMAEDSHSQIHMKTGDRVILSSSPIPGNEIAVKYLINKLLEMGVDVIYESLADVHVSGHACQDELKLMLALTKPKNFVPVHGEYAMLKTHGEIGIELGVSENNTFLIDNGDVLELSGGRIKKAGKVPAGRVLVDGLTVGDVGRIVLKDRKQLSEEGLIVVLLQMNPHNQKLEKDPDIVSRGFIHIRNSEDLIEEAKVKMREDIQSLDPKQRGDWNQVKNAARESLSKYIYGKTKRNPMILVFVQEA